MHTLISIAYMHILIDVRYIHEFVYNMKDLNSLPRSSLTPMFTKSLLELP